MENPKSRAWKVVKSEYLARKPWFTVRHESIELPDGRSIPDYYVFESRLGERDRHNQRG